MANEMEYDGALCISSPTALHRFLVKLLAPALLVLVSFYLVLSAQSTSDSHSFGKVETLAMKSGSTGHCNLFSGKWIPDPLGPAYTNASCSFISTKQNCMTNGRPDTGYLYWRWKPFDCDLPRVDAKKFLNAMHSKSLVFVGDSIFRNQMESLLCLLSEVEEATMVYHDEKYQSKTWYLPVHNVTLALIWAPFLVASTEAQSHSDLQLWLDVLDKTWTEQYNKYDYVILSGGQWFLKETIFLENNTVVGCHYCAGKNIRELGMDYSYRKALQLAFNFMTTADHKPLLILRTWNPDHFENGEWYNGGVCNRTQPFKEGEYNADPVDPIMRGVELEEFERGLNSGLRLKLLDTYYLSLLRPDGHPGPYRDLHPDINKKPQNDCLHWCLPGPIDTWNELLMEILLDECSLMSAS